ncbi:MAG: 1,4-alpha-glucan branching protein GlgB [Pseudanabaenaceae cyanobacterium]
MPASVEELYHIAETRHAYPHKVLGIHPQDGKMAVRAYFPQASLVELLVGGAVIPMQRLGHPDFFEAVADIQPPYTYQFHVIDIIGERTVHDPYAFTFSLWTEFDRYLFGEGNHHHLYEKLGAHVVTVDGVEGVYFSVWAPNARSVSVIGDFNHWDGRRHPMRRENPGVWELFIPDLGEGTHYKYEVRNSHGHIYQKSDPVGFQQEIRPRTASIVNKLEYTWHDQEWMEKRAKTNPLKQPITVYECHLGSWMHGSMDHPPKDGYPAVPAADLKPGARFLTYRELAETLIPYVKEMGFTHIELLPIEEHPFDGSWGYQVVGYYAATSRYGTPQDFMYFIDRCHQEGIGVIIDWVPGHFPKDGHGLAYFDGTHLYEHADPRRGEHKQWGTLIFNYDRNEVRNYLIANAVFWYEKYHIDGMRVDAVSSMLYLDYCREEGDYVLNEFGGRENLGAIRFLRQLHETVFHYFPGILSIAEEATAWPMCTWPTYVGGLGFNLKWNMGWMHDMLDYFHLDPWFRQFHQNNVTFSIMYAFSENFMLALSHDEVVHGKSPMPGKMPGDEWQKFANLRCLYSYMYTHPGKKTLFMGMEFGQWSEWNVWGDLEWHLLQYPLHKGLQRLLKDLNALIKRERALYEEDFSHEGFYWIDCSDNRNSVVSFVRRTLDNEFVVTVCNFTPVVHSSYRIGVPEAGFYREIFNSDATIYGGSGVGNMGGKEAEEISYHGQPYSLDLCLPPLGTLILKPDRQSSTGKL